MSKDPAQDDDPKQRHSARGRSFLVIKGRSLAERLCWLIAALCLAVSASGAQAQDAVPAADSVPTIDVFAATPLAGTGIDITKVPAAVTIIDSQEIEHMQSPNIVRAISQQTPSVNVSEVSGNSFQPDVEFRGFDASPVSGTPEGLAVYQNGVRINEAFGDTVNWDLIPTAAVRSIDVVSNNPAFGLNALGGALTMQMKDGFGFQGTAIDVMGGSYGRIQSSLQWGKQVGNYAVYGALEVAHDGGFRQRSPSDIHRFYGDIGYQGASSELHLNMGVADNLFGATASAPIELLEQNWSSVYTTPQSARNEVGYLNATARVEVTPQWTIQAAAHVRAFNQSTVDGNSTDVESCADPLLLCFNGSAPANGLNGLQLANPFAPGATLGEIDRTRTQTTSLGATLQATDTEPLMDRPNHFVIGNSVDYGVTHFSASAELGTIDPDYFVVGSGIFLGPSGDPVSDGPVLLRTTNLYEGLYAADTLDVTDAFSLTAGGRLNVAALRLQDELGGALTGSDTYTRFNPMIGGTYKISPDVTAYAGYSEANRAPTPLELGCADPLHPCIVANFLVSDPPLKQVVARTFEAGLRGSYHLGTEDGRLTWKAGVFRTDDQDDILNVPSPDQQGFGYFQNVGATRRQGFEAQASFKSEKLSLYASYAFVDATFRNALTLASNSPFADANGNIEVVPGDRIPMIPRNRLKIGAEYALTNALKIGSDVIGVGSQYFAGDASNQAEKLPAYVVVDANASYQINENVEVYARVENLLDNHYYTYGTFFDTTAIPNFANGGAAFTDPRSLTPAEPRAIYAGMKATF
jgi:outer membrane receptor protein involved in Fe transport